MMESDARLEALVTTVPTIKRTPLQQTLRIVQIISTVIAFALVVPIVIVVVRQSSLASCTNNNLGDRNGIQAAESASTQAIAVGLNQWITTLNSAFAVKPGASASERSRITRAFKADSAALQAAATAWQSTLKANAAYRAAHPLGKC
jgi:hypothetical protein